MAKLYTEQYLREIARNKSRELNKGINQIIRENNNKFIQFDIFISHNSLDKEIVLGISIEFTKMGYKPYVYWIVDSHMVKRNTVDKATVNNLKVRLRQSKTLFYATTSNSVKSKWMPWELGFMDGYRDKCAILPISSHTTNQYLGQEYLSLYPYVMMEENIHKQNKLLVCQSSKSCIPFDEWKNNHTKIKSIL